MSDLIKSVTKDCASKNCRITLGWITSTTMGGFCTTYDRNGNVVSDYNPNTSTQPIWCSACNNSWIATTKDGETTIGPATKIEQPASN